MKTLANDLTENQFKMAVQQQLKDNEYYLLQPDTLSSHLGSNANSFQRHLIYTKCHHLRSTTFLNFQEFCRKFSEVMRLKALIQGNVTETHSLSIINSMLNELKFGKIENVRPIGFFFHSKENILSHFFGEFFFQRAFLLDIFNSIEGAEIANRFELFAVQKFKST